MTDREKVVRAVETCFDSWIDKHRYKGLDLHEVERMKHDALELLKSQPDVVRCKDCKYAENYTDIFSDRGYKCLRYDLHREYHNSDWFCADGEKEVK